MKATVEVERNPAPLMVRACGVAPTAREAGMRPVMAGVGEAPVPESEMDCGELLAFPATVIAAVWGPAAVGAKCP